MAKEPIIPNQSIDLANKAIEIPKGPILCSDGRELEIMKWSPICNAGQYVMVSIEAMIYIDKSIIGSTNGTT